MLFNSPEYIFFFLPIALILYFLLLKYSSGNTAKTWLVFASLFFYAWWKLEYLLLISTSIIVNYYLGRYILRAKNKKNATLLLIAGIVLNVGLLAYFKYTNFFLDNLTWLLNDKFSALDIVLPLAISFFTFQQIAYLSDCYGDHDKDYNLLDYSLFVTFFPQLIAGPIVHHREMMPQFSELDNSRFHSSNFARGLFIFGLGLFKKMAIADTFAVWANAGYDSNAPLAFFDAWQVSLSYTFQLYYDFSGYTDMAIGAALMFNIRLPINFNSPYKALNIQDFWRRWHITLSRWLKDYVYIPLGGSRCTKTRTSINLFFTFLIGGIWHGAGWTFIIWGALHGVAIVIFRMWNQTGVKLHAALSWLITFMFVNAAWVFFRAETVGDALRVLRGMTGMNGIYGNTATAKFTLLFTTLFGLIAFLAPNTMEMANHTLPYNRYFRYKKTVAVGLVTGCAMGLGVLFILVSESSEFLYFNF